MVETFRPIPGYEGSYEVSDHGRVRSLARPDTRGRRRIERFLKPRDAKSGHQFVALYAGNRRADWGVHMLVLTAFIGPRPDGLDACHWNDNPRDNRLVNLRWGTRSENVLDCVRNGNHSMANRTHCPQGHEYTPANTYVYPGGNRACQECRRAYREEHKEERRAKGREYMRRKRAQERAAAAPIRKVA